MTFRRWPYAVVEPDLLNCRNGVVDLRTGELLPQDPGYHFMHIAGVPYDPQASSALWEDWLAETVGDPDVARYLQLADGYTLTGRTSEEVVFYIHRPPRSGQGIFTETLRLTLGEQLARVIPCSVLTAKADVDSQNFELAPLKPTRLVLASESNLHEEFNEAS
jgi:putative DNA primase/helicase